VAESSSSKSRFVHVVAHRLKPPVCPVCACATRLTSCISPASWVVMPFLSGNIHCHAPCEARDYHTCESSRRIEHMVPPRLEASQSHQERGTTTLGGVSVASRARYHHAWRRLSRIKSAVPPRLEASQSHQERGTTTLGGVSVASKARYHHTCEASRRIYSVVPPRLEASQSYLERSATPPAKRLNVVCVRSVDAEHSANLANQTWTVCFFGVSHGRTNTARNPRSFSHDEHTKKCCV
jgi:hypothetical protein